MGRSLPLWLFLLCLLLGSLFTLAFGWSAKSTLAGARLGWLGEASLRVASLPDLVSNSFADLREDYDEHLRVPRADVDLTGFHPVRMRSDIHVQGLVVRVDQAAMARASGWRILVGVFQIDGELKHAALALSPQLEVVKVWVLTEDDIQGQEPHPVRRKLIHGFAMLKDGSMIFTWSGGVSIQRFDRCGRRTWSIGGKFDHTVSLDENEKFLWTLSNDYATSLSEVVEVEATTGEVVRRFSMASISAANPMIDVLGARRKEDGISAGANPRNTAEKWQFDAFHVNDVEPLPATIADQFEGFTAGDLLLSVRNLNLVFVIDPETLRVKWSQSGVSRRQHDADWQPTGEITVYDNRMGRDYSRILGISPASNSTRVVFDGRTNDFYSFARGKHQITKVGNTLITSSQQGRVFEVDSNGQFVFEILNNKLESKDWSYFLSEVIWFPLGAFDFAKDSPCADST